MGLKYFFLGLLLWTSVARADESSVFLCRVDGDAINAHVVRMKSYFDENEKLELGKVDRLLNAEVLESTPTKVIQIPLLDRDSYVQIWYGQDLTLDAQLTYDQGTRPFRANYKKNNEKLNLLCRKIRE